MCCHGYFWLPWLRVKVLLFCCFRRFDMAFPSNRPRWRTTRSRIFWRSARDPDPSGCILWNTLCIDYCVLLWNPAHLFDVWTLRRRFLIDHCRSFSEMNWLRHCLTTTYKSFPSRALTDLPFCYLHAVHWLGYKIFVVLYSSVQIKLYSQFLFFFSLHYLIFGKQTGKMVDEDMAGQR